MAYIPIGEAIKRLGKSDRQVRRMVHSGKLTYRYAPDKKLEILSSDVDRLSRHALPAQELERLDRLERELIQLRAQLDTLSNRVDTFITPRERSPQKPTTGPIIGSRGEVLPAGYIAIYDLIRQYGLVRRRQAIIRNMKPYLKTGSWNVGGHEVKHALDQEGIEEFKRRYVTQE